MDRLDLKEQIICCEECELHARCTAPVPFSGPTPAEYAVLGEAPGRTEDKKGEPFIGRAGLLMRMYMEEAGLDPDKAFIFNTVSCFPDATPRASEVIACRQNKLDQLAISEAKVVLVMGGIALGGLRPDLQITKAHGRVFSRDGVVFLPTFHPAGALRKHDWEVEMQREIGMFSRLVRQMRENDRSWMEFIVEDCVLCGKTLLEMGNASQAIRFDDEGIVYCERCWPASPQGRSEKAA